MSEETSSQPEDTVSRSELNNLQEQLKATRMERDRQIFEKSEIVAKANAYAKERDDLRDSLAAMTAERDRLATEKAEASTKAFETSRQLEAASRRGGGGGRAAASRDRDGAVLRSCRGAVEPGRREDQAGRRLGQEQDSGGQSGAALVRQDHRGRHPDRLHRRQGGRRLHSMGGSQGDRAVQPRQGGARRANGEEIASQHAGLRELTARRAIMPRAVSGVQGRGSGGRRAANPCYAAAPPAGRPTRPFLPGRALLSPRA
jgi:hypothetical protein